MLDPTLAGKGETDLVGYGAAEGTLGWGRRARGTWVRPGLATPASSSPCSQGCAKAAYLSLTFRLPTLSPLRMTSS